jgi:hypothetical protein
MVLERLGERECECADLRSNVGHPSTIDAP